MALYNRMHNETPCTHITGLSIHHSQLYKLKSITVYQQQTSFMLLVIQKQNPYSFHNQHQILLRIYDLFLQKCRQTQPSAGLVQGTAAPLLKLSCGTWIGWFMIKTHNIAGGPIRACRSWGNFDQAFLPHCKVMTSDAKRPALRGYGKQCAHVMLWPQLDHHSEATTTSSLMHVNTQHSKRNHA